MFRRYSGLFPVLMAVVALVTASGTALAFVPDPGASLEVPLRNFDLHNYSTPATQVARAAVEQSASSALGGTWKVYTYNSQTSTVTDLYGSGMQVRAAFATDEDAIQAARAVVNANPRVFGVGDSDLRVWKSPVGHGKRSVHFQQTYHGVDVYGGRAYLIFTEAGRLFGMGSDCHPAITVSPDPSIPPAVAQDIANRALLGYDGKAEPFEPKLWVLPVPQSETTVAYHLVWQVQVRTEEPFGVWSTFVDAHDGQILWRFNEVCFADYVGGSSSLVQRPSYCEGQSAEPVPHLRVQISGVGQAITDAAGNWTIPYAGSDPRTVTADLYGPWCDLDNMGGAEGTFTGTATPGVPLTVAFTDLNAQRDEKDVFQAVNGIHDFYEDIDPSYYYTNRRMPAHVRVSGTCNAYWYVDEIHFYADGGGCHNTGEIMGVVQHEFCHGITQHLIGSQGSNGIGEGNSDILSNLIIGESIIGRGFYEGNCSSGIRDSENTLQYPDDLNGSIHHDGQIIAGFHWDSWQALQQTLTPAEARHIVANTWHWGRVHRAPATHPAQVLATFYEDDDDGDLTNGTPHHAEFCEGATNHGYDCPEILVGVFITHEPLLSRTTPGDAEVVANIYTTEGALVPDSLRLRYRLNGGSFTSVRMEPTGGTNEYAATIPGLAQGTEVEYYLRARDLAGNTKTSPENAPANLWAFDICNLLDQQEAESGWAVNVEGTDNAASGLWVRVDPIGTTYNGAQIQPEDDRTPAPGVACWITGQHTPGESAGFNDVDGGTTTLYSPVYDLTGATVAKAKYYRWYSDDRGLNAGDDDWVVQVRNNDGAWQNVEVTDEEAAYWKQVSVDLTALFGSSIGNVQLKFMADDSGANSLTEAAIDEFSILLTGTDAAPDWTSGPARFALLGSRPNPVRQAAEIGFSVPARTDVRIAVFDVSGRQVQVIADGAYDAGVHVASWDGQDAAGHAVASGIYYLKMQAAEFTATRTLVLAR